MIVGGLKILINMSLYASVPNWVQEIPNHLKTQERCNEAVYMEPYCLLHVPDHLKTQEMCCKAVHKKQ